MTNGDKPRSEALSPAQDLKRQVARAADELNSAIGKAGDAGLLVVASVSDYEHSKGRLPRVVVKVYEEIP